jgi:broad specificity phosphatase PhoE
MNLLLARHGNTFGPDDKPVWVGANEDMPLVAKGRDQAKALGEAIAGSRLQLAAIVTGPLKRTVEHAGIASAIAGGPQVEVDHRLREIDYGKWGGKSTEEIVATEGESAVNAWNERGQWPERAGWQPDPSDLRRDLKLLVNDLRARFGKDSTVMLVSSNGILRFFLDLVPGEFALRARDGELKTATGGVSALAQQGGLYRVAFWNEKPSASLLDQLAAPETEA